MSDEITNTIPSDAPNPEETVIEQEKDTAKATATPKDNTSNLVAKLLEQETSPEIMELKRLILRRIATETDIRPARVPAPMNITEIGGYYNLIKKDEKLRLQLLASVLGLPYSS